MIAFPDVMENDSDHVGLGMFTLLAVHDWIAKHPQQIQSPAPAGLGPLATRLAARA